MTALALDAGPLRGLKVLEISDLPRWKSALALGGETGFGCYFPYVLAHQRPGRSTVLIAEDAGCLCVFIQHERNGKSHLDVFLNPIPMNIDVTRRCLDRANDFNGDWSARILRIDGNDASQAARIPGVGIRVRRQQYLFAPRAFVDLRGAKYQTLRRHVARIRKLPELEVVPYSERFASGCRVLLEQWSKRHRKKFGKWGDVGLSRRVLDVADAISSPDITGEVVLLGERLAAYCLGGEIRPGLGCFLDTKSDLDVPGLGYFQRHSFYTNHDSFDLINDGSDAGSAGLRQMKDSLRPAAMHMEYRGIQAAA
jgi:hypothetical protein